MACRAGNQPESNQQGLDVPFIVSFTLSPPATTTAASRLHSSDSACIGHAASEEAALGNRLEPCPGHPSFGSPEPPSQEGCNAKQAEELHTKEEEDVGAEEVVKEEPEPEEESAA